MIKYNREDLYSVYVQQQCAEALAENCIDDLTYKNIVAQYPIRLYTPNVFIRIGLVLLTALIVSFLFLLVGLSMKFESVTALCFFISIACYVSLELLISNSNHYNAGVDNALSFYCAAFCFSGCAILFKGHNGLSLPGCIITLALCSYLAIRFTDAFMVVIAFLLMLLTFLSALNGSPIMILEPFVFMTICTVVFVLVQKQKNKFWLFPYFKSFAALNFIAALCFYAAGNYYIVSSLTGYMHFNTAIKVKLSMGWFFWSWTILLPFVYLTFGILRKNTLFLRMGLALVIVAVLTFRHYYSVMPAEIAMILGGIVFIIPAYSLIRFLKTPKHGFTFEEGRYQSEGTTLSHELIKNTLAHKTTVHSQVPNSRNSPDY